MFYKNSKNTIGRLPGQIFRILNSFEMLIRHKPGSPAFMFEEFPKKRTPLPPKYQAIYADYYKRNRNGSTIATWFSQKMERWLHKKVAEDCSGKQNRSTLEIGAGTLNHLSYENNKPYDIIEPFKELYANSPALSKINRAYEDISGVPEGTKYDRIISIAAFEHITGLPFVVAKSCLLLNEKGVLRVAIPNDGTLLWKLAWKLTTGLEFRLKYGLDYSVLMKHEHVNEAGEVEKVLSHFYTRLKCSCFGFSKQFAFYRFYECRDPKVNEALNFLNSIKR